MRILGGLYFPGSGDSWSDGKLRFTAFNPRKKRAIPMSIDQVRGGNSIVHDYRKNIIFSKWMRSIGRSMFDSFAKKRALQVV